MRRIFLLAAACLALLALAVVHAARTDESMLPSEIAGAQCADSSLPADLSPSAALLPASDGVVYSASDSIEVERLLSAGGGRSPLDYARRLVGRPYVAHTLDGAYTADGDRRERLVVNLSGLDCLTLVENVCALSRATDWTSFCANLQSLRYFDGRIDGYASRLHYLTFSIADHLQRGDMEEVVLPERLTRPRTVNIDFMSRHPQYYDALKTDTALTHVIARLEQHYSGASFRYLPQDNCHLSRRELGGIHDGDIIYIVTSKDGLDYSHQGIAFWGSDGQLHMLHASSERKRVIADERPLANYLRRVPTSLGIRVFRLR